MNELPYISKRRDGTKRERDDLRSSQYLLKHGWVRRHPATHVIEQAVHIMLNAQHAFYGTSYFQVKCVPNEMYISRKIWCRIVLGLIHKRVPFWTPVQRAVFA